MILASFANYMYLTRAQEAQDRRVDLIGLFTAPAIETMLKYLYGLGQFRYIHDNHHYEAS